MLPVDIDAFRNDERGERHLRESRLFPLALLVIPPSLNFGR